MAVAAGHAHSVAVSEDGILLAWGSGWHDQPGTRDNVAHVDSDVEGEPGRLVVCRGGNLLGPDGAMRALPGAAAAPGRAHAPFGRAARRTHRAQRPALRHNHRRAGPSPDAPLRGRLRAP